MQVHQPVMKIQKMNWNTVENREQQLFHVECNPPSVRLLIPCRDYLCRVRRLAWRRRRRHRHPRQRQWRRPHHRCTRRTVSTISCRSTAASSPLGIDLPASPETVILDPARSAADRNVPSAHRACKFPARNRPPASGTIPDRGGSRRCRSRRVGHIHISLNDRPQVIQKVECFLITDFLTNIFLIISLFRVLHVSVLFF